MASAPQQTGLPLFYNDLVPLNTEAHANYHARSTDKAQWISKAHAVPLTVEEFPLAQRNFPIVFSTGDEPVPLALMGLNEGVNVFFDEEGTVSEPIYIPAYVRRYPFMLAKLQPDSTELSLCFDPTTDLVGEFDEGAALFDDGKPSAATQQTLKFCEQFEMAGQKTAAFIEEIKKYDLLTEGELTMNVDGLDKPFVYRGFTMINEEKLRDLRGDVLRGWNQNGMLPLIFAHMFSLTLVRDIFSRQHKQGKMPAIG